MKLNPTIIYAYFMIHLPFSLSKAHQTVNTILMLIENAQNGEDKITEIDRAWHQLYGIKIVLDCCEVELMRKAVNSIDLAEYREFIQIRELLYQHMILVEEMYEKVLAHKNE